MSSTAINSRNFSITSERDGTIEAFGAERNYYLEYLPNNLGAKFPNLLYLVASMCSIKKISKDNFEGLSNLRNLILPMNEIEKIDDDTFEHILAVEEIHLDENKIKKLNGRAFASLTKLTMVELSRNECIDEEFDTAERIAEMPRDVTEKCGFTGNEPDSTKIAKPIVTAGPCEKITFHECKMKSTAINSKEFTITSRRDETVEGFDAFSNRNLRHLPNNLGAKFPNLIKLDAARCSIKEISTDVFVELSKLRQLWLYWNRIEKKIDDDTFEHMPAVEEIHLTYNKIKELNGIAFASLPKLTKVGLQANECIDEEFDTAARIDEMPRVITEKCGFMNSKQSTTKLVDSETDLMA